jgi:uncharacterized lipoprotein YbaY
MRRSRLIALALGAGATAAAFVPTPALAATTYCPYAVSTSYASVYSRPTVNSQIYDALPHGAHVTASSSTISGTGGPFRKAIAAYGTAYIQSNRLTRIGGSCFGSNQLRAGH